MQLKRYALFGEKPNTEIFGVSGIALPAGNASEFIYLLLLIIAAIAECKILCLKHKQ